MSKILDNQFSTEIVNLESMIPENHFLRVIKKHFDWNFIYDEVEKLYSKLGRKYIDKDPNIQKESLQMEKPSMD